MPAPDAPTEAEAWQHALDEAALLSPMAAGLATTLPIDPLEFPKAQDENPLSSASNEDETASGFGPVKREIAE
jgi:hypothetical protein